MWVWMQVLAVVLALGIYNVLCMWLYIQLYYSSQSEYVLEADYGPTSTIATGLMIHHFAYIFGLLLVALYLLGYKKFEVLLENSNARLGNGTSTDHKTGLWRFSLAIGWMQTIICGFSLAGCILLSPALLVIHFVNKKNREDDIFSKADKQPSSDLVLLVSISMAILILRHLVGFIAGNILISGVQQGDPGKLKVWNAIEVIFLPSTIVALNRMEAFNHLSNYLYVIIDIFLIAIVHFHQRSLLNPHSSRFKKPPGKSYNRVHDVVYMRL